MKKNPTRTKRLSEINRTSTSSRKTNPSLTVSYFHVQSSLVPRADSHHAMYFAPCCNVDFFKYPRINELPHLTIMHRDIVVVLTLSYEAPTDSVKVDPRSCRMLIVCMPSQVSCVSVRLIDKHRGLASSKDKETKRLEQAVPALPLVSSSGSGSASSSGALTHSALPRLSSSTSSSSTSSAPTMSTARTTIARMFPSAAHGHRFERVLTLVLTVPAMRCCVVGASIERRSHDENVLIAAMQHAGLELKGLRASPELAIDEMDSEAERKRRGRPETKKLSTTKIMGALGVCESRARGVIYPEFTTQLRAIVALVRSEQPDKAPRLEEAMTNVIDEVKTLTASGN